jgi:glycine cleavage system aminomethyltransferase T
VNVGLSDEEFPYSTSQLVQVAGHLCRAVRYSLVGELGWELHIPWDSCSAVYEAILIHGKKYDLKHAGYRALHSLSIEKGMLFLNDNNPINLFCMWLHAFVSLFSWAIAPVSGRQLVRYDVLVGQ